MKKGFTLIELLVVISIIGLLSSVVLASLSTARDKTRIGAGRQFEANLNHTLGLVAEYTFENGNVNDTSGNSNNGTVTGTPVFDSDTPNTSSKFSFNVNGSSEWFAVNRGLGISDNNFTIAHWVKTTSNGTNVDTVTNTGGWGGYRFGLGGTGGGYITYLIGISDVPSVGESHPCSTKKVNDGVWHHIAGVFDRTNLKFTCYIDGIQAGSNTLLQSYPGMPDAIPTIPNKYSTFLGQIDNVRIYNQNLSGISIRNIYESEKDKFFAKKTNNLNSI